jgi:3-oxoacyl-[acyl-carrier protein] reductase
VGPGFRRECDYFFLRGLRVFVVNRGIVIASEAKQSRADSSAPEAHAMITADLTGKTALVTGGASGIGLATVEAFARAGATVALNHLADDARGAQQVERLKGLGHRIVAAPGNVSKPGEAETMVARAIDGLGRLDFLVNNAGTPATPAPIPFAELDRLDEDFWQTILNTNLIGPFRCSHAAVGALRAAKGAICSTASIAGVQGSGSSIPYATSKAGVINLTRSLARTLAPDVRVNAVAPGFVDSPWNKDWPADRKVQSIERTPLKRACRPEDIAETIFFLCAGGAMITGQTIIVDGGLTL